MSDPPNPLAPKKKSPIDLQAGGSRAACHGHPRCTALATGGPVARGIADAFASHQAANAQQAANVLALEARQSGQATPAPLPMPTAVLPIRVATPARAKLRPHRRPFPDATPPVRASTISWAG